MCFSKTLSLRLRTIIQVIFISILYVLASMVFFQAHLLKIKKKTDRPQPGAHLENLCHFFFVYIAKQIKTKALWRSKTKKARTTLELHHAGKQPGKTPHTPKMAQFLKGGKNGHSANCRYWDWASKYQKHTESTL